jgi:hypothetical protein
VSDRAIVVAVPGRHQGGRTVLVRERAPTPTAEEVVVCGLLAGLFPAPLVVVTCLNTWYRRPTASSPGRRGIAQPPENTAAAAARSACPLASLAQDKTRTIVVIPAGNAIA